MDKFYSKVIFANIILLLISFLNASPNLPISVVYDQDNELSNEYNRNLINKAAQNGHLNMLNIRNLFVDKQNQKNITESICNQFSSQGFGLILQAPIKRHFQSPLNLLTLFSQAKNIPFIDFDNHDSLLEKSSPLIFKPDLSQLLIELIKSHHKPIIHYIYNHAGGFYLAEKLLNYHQEDKNFANDILLRKLNYISESVGMLKFIRESANSTNQIKIIVDLDTNENFNKIMANVKYLGLDRPPFEFILMSMEIYELDLDSFVFADSSIIGFSLIDYTNIDTIKLQNDLFSSEEPLNKIKPIPLDSAYLIDSILFLNSNSINFVNLLKNRELDCFSNDLMIKSNKNADALNIKSLNAVKGLTSTLSFDSNGKRTNFRIIIHKIAHNMHLKKIGSYESKHNRIEYTKNYKIQKENKDITKQRTDKRLKIKVVSILYDKFLYETTYSSNLTGNDRYDGYCADLAKHLAETIDVDYELTIVKDGKFGIKDGQGNWSGIVGELIRHEADVAIAPLTITKERRKSIQFSQPFLDGYLSIVMKKPKQKNKINEFNFVEMFDAKIWSYFITFYISVSILLAIIGHFSPYENENNETNHQFTIFNSFWFSIASLTKQRVDLSPKSTSGRVLVIFWWSFSLLIFLIYVSNVTSFLLYQHNNIETIKSITEMTNDKLSNQTDIKYGIIEGGSTHQFFKNNKNEIYKKMWQQMNAWGSSVLVKDISNGVRKMGEYNGNYALIMEMFSNAPVTSGQFECSLFKVGNNIRSVSYGVATYYGSDLINLINNGLTKLRENGYLDKLKKKWLNVECKNSKNEHQNQPYQLKYFKEMSLTLLGALCIAIMFSICEFIFRKYVFKV